MKIKKLIVVILTQVLVVSVVNSQNITTRQVGLIHSSIYQFLDDNAPAIDSANSEFMFVVLLTDSMSRITEVHILADEMNKTYGFPILQKLSPIIFKDIHLENFSGKTIVVPVYMPGIDNKPAYANRKPNCADLTLWELPLYGDSPSIVKENYRSVLTSGVMFLYTPKIHCNSPPCY
jgi:hypothetical protein